MNWNEYTFTPENLSEHLKKFSNDINSFFKTFDSENVSIELKEPIISTSLQEKKYIIDIANAKGITKVNLILPNTKDASNQEAQQKEENLAELLYSITEIRVKSITICFSTQNNQQSTDISILIAILSKLRNCINITLVGMSELTSSPKYTDKLKVPKSQIIDQDIKNLMICLRAVPISSIKMLGKNIFEPNRKSIRLIRLFEYNENALILNNLFETYGVRVEKGN
ncbi:hypothetical protein NEFER01_0391 [Nematocida sp. LUAm1]|nr:hypothetical protein NEFER02_1906 [Nematocida sp. LUAm2]KAI5177116.1 hypothetical protein NEFER01_0391 [Nematocida sp. LUAm1]